MNQINPNQIPEDDSIDYNDTVNIVYTNRLGEGGLLENIPAESVVEYTNGLKEKGCTHIKIRDY